MEKDGEKPGPFMDLLNLIPEDEREKTEKNTTPRIRWIGGPDCI